MKNKLKRSDFGFRYVAYGCYSVSYTSPVTGRMWSTLTKDMELIDCTKNTDNPKKKDLERLRRICKN